MSTPADSIAGAGLQVLLLEPEIPPNTGNIARLCASTGTRLHLVEPLGFELSDRQLRRAGMDYWQHVDWRVWPDWETARRGIRGSTWHFFTTKATRAHWSATYQPGDVLVFGRETRGLPEALLNAHAEHAVCLPMTGEGARSLNLATSVGAALYEALRQCAKG